MPQWLGLEIPGWALVLIAIGFVVIATRKKPSSASNPRGSSARGGSKGKASPRGATPASDAAKAVAKILGVAVGARRIPVTVCVNHVLLRQEESGDWMPIESALPVVALLSEVASVFLVAWVDTDYEERRVKEAALSAGLIRASSDSTDTNGIPQHRLLFCSSHVGQVAVVRQLTPSLHIGGSIGLLEGISRFVPSLIRIDPGAIAPPPEVPPLLSPSGPERSKAGHDSLGWREYKSLAAAAGLTAAEAPARALESTVESAVEPTSVEGAVAQAPEKGVVSAFVR